MTPNSPIALSSNGNATKRQELDNLIRRELRVGDPSDPAQIAEALMKRYGNTPQARSLVNEAKGLPFLQTVSLAPATPVAPTATTSDWAQATSDIDADLKELFQNTQLKDIQPELQGWARAIRSALQEGYGSAPLAMDTRQRDKTFAIRRQLGEYARAARLVGTLNFRARDDFRSLAQSLDEACAVLLVMMGEAIAGTGIAGGRFLLQVPFSELQTRREAVLYALRNLNGASQQGYTANDWPRGLDAYRQLCDFLETQGQGELRSLLMDSEISRVMDELIDRAGQGTDGLRALGATAQIDLQRFQRLIAMIAWRASDPESPALTALHEALQLFIDGFKSTGGIRLVTIARPTILMYGLYGGRDIGRPEQRLIELVQVRGNLASALDCASECLCDTNQLVCQALLDKVLYDLDRTIDLYAVSDGQDMAGTTLEMSVPEVRAAAYSYVFEQIASLSVDNAPCLAPDNATDDKIRTALSRARALLRPVDKVDSNVWLASDIERFEAARTGINARLPGRDSVQALLVRELVIQATQEQHLMDVAQQMGDGCLGLQGLKDAVVDLLNQAEVAIKANTQQKYTVSRDFTPRIPSTVETSGDGQAFLRLPTGEVASIDIDALLQALAAELGGQP